MRLQSILLPQLHICTEATVYFHQMNDIQDFDGYFNLFYIEKHKKYTTLNGLQLVLTLQGYTSIALMHDRDSIQTIKLSSQERREYVFSFPYERYEKGVFWFRLERNGAIGQNFIQGYYDGITDRVREVNIAVDICTYKREAYVERNMRNISTLFTRMDKPEAAQHVQVRIIDNGQTLHKQAELKKIIKEQNGKIQIIPNCNNGGAGGFTRGMQEVIKQKETFGFTHVLLMDDDAVFDIDVFIRIYGLLTTLKEEYKDIIVGGSLWREDYPYIQFACGEEFHHMNITNKHPLLDMRFYEACTQEDMCTTKYEHSHYSGWWLCCYSLNVVRPDNLPLPVFIHFDDIEYNLRNRDYGIVFLNGIGVWHRGFELNFHKWQEYYNIRNSLITVALHEPDMPLWKIKVWIWRHLIGLFINYRYIDMQLAIWGIEDFLKGPEWLLNLDAVEHNRKLQEYVKKHMKFYPVEELPLSQKESVKQEAKKYDNGVSLEQLQKFYTPQRHKASLWKKLSLNGWLLPAKKGEAFITPLDTPWKSYRHHKIILYEPMEGRGMVVEQKWKMILVSIHYYFLITRLGKSDFILWKKVKKY